MSTTPRKQEPAWPSGALARETIRLRRVHIGRMSARFLAIAHALDDAADAMLAACVKAEHRGDHYHDSHDDPVKKAVYEARDKVFERAMLYLQTELREKTTGGNARPPDRSRVRPSAGPSGLKRCVRRCFARPCSSS